MKVWQHVKQRVDLVKADLSFTRQRRYGHEPFPDEVEFARIDNYGLWLNQSDSALSESEAVDFAKWILDLYSENK